MNEILRKRLLRKLETLPDAQLYQVLDYIEFLESKYATSRAAEPGGLQRFAERMEDRLRARAVLPEVMSGTMKVFGTAGRLLDGISEAGRGIVEGVETGLRPPAPRRPPAAPEAERRDAGMDTARAGEEAPPPPPSAHGGSGQGAPPPPPPAQDGSGEDDAARA